MIFFLFGSLEFVILSKVNMMTENNGIPVIAKHKKLLLVSLSDVVKTVWTQIQIKQLYKKWKYRLSADNVFKQFGPRSGPTNYRTWLWSKLFDKVFPYYLACCIGISFFLMILVRSNFDHFTRECKFWILRKKKKQQQKKKRKSSAVFLEDIEKICFEKRLVLKLWERKNTTDDKNVLCSKYYFIFVSSFYAEWNFPLWSIWPVHFRLRVVGW